MEHTTTSAKTIAQPISSLVRSSLLLQRGSLLQRKCACGTHTISGGQCEKCKTRDLQKPFNIGASNNPLKLERVADPGMSRTSVSRDSAQPDSSRPLERALPHDVKQRFGQDFSEVGTYAGATATQSQRNVGVSSRIDGAGTRIGKLDLVRANIPENTVARPVSSGGPVPSVERNCLATSRNIPVQLDLSIPRRTGPAWRTLPRQGRESLRSIDRRRSAGRRSPTLRSAGAKSIETRPGGEDGVAQGHKRLSLGGAGVGALIGGVAGAGIGFLVGGPIGALAGAGLGGVAGGLIGHAITGSGAAVPSLSLANDSYTDNATESRKNIRFNVAIPSGQTSGDYALVNWIKGHMKDGAGNYFKVKMYGSDVDANYASYQVDSVDADPVYWSDAGGRWNYKSASGGFYATDSPGPALTSEHGAEYALNFKIGLYRLADVPTTTAGSISATPIQILPWQYSVKVSAAGTFSHPSI